MGTVRSDLAALVLGVTLSWSAILVLILGTVVAWPLLVLGGIVTLVAVIW